MLSTILISTVLWVVVSDSLPSPKDTRTDFEKSVDESDQTDPIKDLMKRFRRGSK